MPDASTSFVLRDERHVKDWIGDDPSISLPSTDEVRPSSCPDCGAPARPPGEGLNLYGHGIRARTILGPLSFDDFTAGSPQRRTILIRRFRCQVCHTTMTVVPRQVRPYGVYLTLAVVGAFALWLYHPDGLPIEVVRAWISPRETDYPGWLQLRRWAKGAHHLPDISQANSRAPPRLFAASVVQQVAAQSPAGRDLAVWKRSVWQLAGADRPS